MLKKHKRSIIPIFLLPLLIVYVVFQLYPIILNVIYSCLNWNGINKWANFIGLENYKEIVFDGLFWNAFKNSIVFAIFGTLFQVFISFSIAYFIEFNSFKLKKTIRLIFIMPIVATSATIGIIMKAIFSYNGALNILLKKIGMGEINWLADPVWAFIMIILVSIWKETGTLFIYWIASFKLVSSSIIDAANLDGVTEKEMFAYIIFPIIKPVVLFVSVITFINSLKVFDIIQTLTSGGPYFSTDMLSTYIYRTAFSSSFGAPRLSYASAASVLCLIFILIIAYISKIIFKNIKRK
ncbi:carbohydrate ABC transporter permease [Clostridium butyricum]|uniref:carbohydrate ABC transporter permease n=1 Tax=Clostridium butyricum TaxID=1492 RepID=UPI000903BAF2|nr:sugar ABC transporter permease [Clostridium butyricum]APF24857.1 binding--dependent transport system inner membrane component family protein [Clostridium butyricum]